MAKRTPRSDADDNTASIPTRSRARVRGTKRADEAPAEDRAAIADDPTVASAPTMPQTQAARPYPADTQPPEDTIAADPRVSETNHVAQVGGATEDEIRQRAYEIYMRRGGTHGLHDDDWYQAERELGIRN